MSSKPLGDPPASVAHQDVRHLVQQAKIDRDGDGKCAEDRKIPVRTRNGQDIVRTTASRPLIFQPGKLSGRQRRESCPGQEEHHLCPEYDITCSHGGGRASRPDRKAAGRDHAAGKTPIVKEFRNRPYALRGIHSPSCFQAGNDQIYRSHRRREKAARIRMAPAISER